MIQIAPYDSEWPSRFERERAALTRILRGTGAVIEHVGSTAVRGLGAKPIIDIMVGVVTLRDIESRIASLERRGYEYVPEYEEQLPDRRYFRKPAQPPRRYHLHAVVKGCDFWRDHLLLRDYLRGHPDVASRYAELKRHLAVEQGLVGVRYTEAKSSFIETVLAAARAEGLGR